jgi:hypothetical protein
MKINKHIDPLTGEAFVPKKISQRFACPTNRIKYNNLKASKLKQDRAFMDKHTHKNHSILREIYIDNEVNTFNEMWLRGKGLCLYDAKCIYRSDDISEYQIYEYILIRTCGFYNIRVIKTRSIPIE